MTRAFQIALGFLTVFRMRVDPVPDMAEVGRSAWAFPLVGVGMGLVLIACKAILFSHFPGIVAAVLLVGIWIVLTGGLHLDGWTDCWDALPTAVSPERRLEILKDSRLGTFGALGLLVLLGLKVAAVAMPEMPAAALLIAPMAGRTMLVAVGYGAPCGDTGMAAQFIRGLERTSVKRAWIIAVIVAFLTGWSGLIALAGAYGASLAFRAFARARLGVVNGDVLGAACELSEVVVLLIFL
jgi:adenosylcobinamide-GDP ribazoletransferase